MEEKKITINAMLLIRFTELLRRFYTYYADELSALDVKDIHAKYLHMIADHPGMTQQEISNLSMMKRSTVSEIMSQMEQLNLVERKADVKDGRVLRIYLTDYGDEKANVIKALFDEFVLKCYKQFSNEEIEQFEVLIKKFNYPKQTNIKKDQK